MRKRYLLMLLASAMVIGGCSGNTERETEATEAKTTAEEISPEQTSAEQESGNDGVIELEFWHALENQYEGTLNRVVEEFNESQDSIVVTPLYIGDYAALNEAIVTAHAAGTALPGLAMANIPYVSGYGSGGVCEDLGPYIERDNFEIDDFGEGLLQAGRYGGTQIALPFLVSTEVVFYNQDLMDELGLQIPEKWDEMQAFLEAGSLVDERGNTSRYGMVIPGWNTWYYGPFFVNSGLQMITEDNVTDLDSEKSVELVEQLQDWCNNGYTYLAVGEDAASVMRQRFMKGEALSVVYTSSLYDTMVDTCDFKIGMSWLPEKETKFEELGGNVLFIPAKNDQQVKDAAWEFLSYLMSKEVNMIWASESGYLPTRKSVQETEEGKAFLAEKPAFQVVFDNLDLITPPIQRSDWSQVTTVWQNYMAEIIQEGLNVEEALSEMAQEINDILADSAP